MCHLLLLLILEENHKYLQMHEEKLLQKMQQKVSNVENWRLYLA